MDAYMLADTKPQGTKHKNVDLDMQTQMQVRGRRLIYASIETQMQKEDASMQTQRQIQRRRQKRCYRDAGAESETQICRCVDAGTEIQTQKQDA